MAADDEIIEEGFLVTVLDGIVAEDEEQSQQDDGHNGQHIEADGTTAADQKGEEDREQNPEIGLFCCKNAAKTKITQHLAPVASYICRWCIISPLS